MLPSENENHEEPKAIKASEEIKKNNVNQSNLM
jgi:hypothetical protein